jgi:hypothetical protein
VFAVLPETVPDRAPLDGDVGAWDTDGAVLAVGDDGASGSRSSALPEAVEVGAAADACGPAVGGVLVRPMSQVRASTAAQPVTASASARGLIARRS